MTLPNIGDIVYTIAGHPVRIVDILANGWQFCVSLYQDVCGDLIEIQGAPVLVGRSELRLD